MEERKMLLFLKGKKKIMRELDAINLLNRLRKLDLLLSLSLNKD